MRPGIVIAILFGASAALAQDNGAFDSNIPNDKAIAQASAACGPDNIKFDVINADQPQPALSIEPGKALVYVIEQPAYCGDFCSPTIKTGVDGSWMGASQGYSYMSFPISPGERHLCAKWQSSFASRNQVAALAHFTAESGKAYYFRVRAIDTYRVGVLIELDRIDSDEGHLLVASYPLSISRPKGGKRGSGKAVPGP